jgi:hypothetical protein
MIRTSIHYIIYHAHLKATTTRQCTEETENGRETCMQEAHEHRHARTYTYTTHTTHSDTEKYIPPLSTMTTLLTQSTMIVFAKRFPFLAMHLPQNWATSVARSDHKHNYGCNATSSTSTATTPPHPCHLRTLLCLLPCARSIYNNRMVYGTCESLLLVSCLAQTPGWPASNFAVNWLCMHHSDQAALTYALNKTLLWPPCMAN